VSPPTSGPAWPAALWIVRHGESAGNVARIEAEAAGLAVLDLATRDMDVPLSSTGAAQAVALGTWLGSLAEDDRPTVTITSPYVRAIETARLAWAGAGVISPEPVRDERLREREFGILDRLTRAGIEARFPEQAAARAFLGKFWHRPPGGESWADVALRLRSFLDTLGREHAGERVLVVGHQVVVLVLRYLLERMTEDEILAVDRVAEVANCSVTEYRLGAERMVLRRFNDVTHLRREGEPVTTEPDRPVAPR
jgi:broad specificity phosphatase PhoE